ncbi:uncharacterized protein LOC128250374 isoform X2 [Octopus bimaculoides]|nr:uncharacterized protein LOC128250374 isoform X2 [Octopus bimaculoides]XP_052831244.1 uncharacterized protein LOC128250374 isoform X2 [Octopus bimaculoides]XP_052831245.1 uncharacterized protein LOC128250374 isoform X2 [Octopus bimaculoides]XP_052831246.1 uncharacterized protein LOC128250374 isoform X2 [Octopus bimaculoides]
MTGVVLQCQLLTTSELSSSWRISFNLINLSRIKETRERKEEKDTASHTTCLTIELQRMTKEYHQDILKSKMKTKFLQNLKPLPTAKFYKLRSNLYKDSYKEIE